MYVAQFMDITFSYGHIYLFLVCAGLNLQWTFACVERADPCPDADMGIDKGRKRDKSDVVGTCRLSH